MTNAKSGSLLCCLVVLLLAACSTAASGQFEGNVENLLGRRLMLDANGKRVVLKDRTLALLTKHELPNAKSSNSTAKVYALFGWQQEEKAIKYSVVSSTSAAEALTATAGEDIKGIHLGVMGTRGGAAKAEMPLAKNAGAFPVKDGFQIYAVGTIMDSNVSSWTNTLGYKTVAQLWESILDGECVLTVLTAKYPEGEVRGQIDWSYDDLETVEDTIEEKIRATADNWRLTFLTPYEQISPVTGNKTSRGMGVYAWDGSKILYHILAGSKSKESNLHLVNGYKDIKGVSLYLGAMRGQNAVSSIPLTMPADADWKVENGLRIYAQGSITDDTLKVANGNSSKLAVTTAKALYDMILAGNTYTNVQTVANPSGDIRGQNDVNYAAVTVLKDQILAGSPGASPAGSKSSAPMPGTSSLAIMIGATLATLQLLLPVL